MEGRGRRGRAGASSAGRGSATRLGVNSGAEQISRGGAGRGVWWPAAKTGRTGSGGLPRDSPLSLLVAGHLYDTSSPSKSGPESCPSHPLTRDARPGLLSSIKCYLPNAFSSSRDLCPFHPHATSLPARSPRVDPLAEM